MYPITKFDDIQETVGSEIYNSLMAESQPDLTVNYLLEYMHERGYFLTVACVDCWEDACLEWGPCPYASEINDDHTEMWICLSCRDLRADGI